MVGYIAGGAGIGALSGGAAAGLGALGAGAVVSGAIGGAVGGAGFSGLTSNWNAEKMIQGAVVGGVSGAIGGGINSIYGYDPIGLVEGTCKGALFGGATGFVGGGLTNMLFGGSFMDGATQGAIFGGVTGALYGGINGVANAKKLGVNPITGGTLDERAQAWANYFGMDGFRVSAFDKGDIEYWNSVSDKFTFERDGNIVRAIPRSGDKPLDIDGYFGNKDAGGFITKSAVRNMRFNGGWGKGTLYHEYGHFIGLKDPAAYALGLSVGRYGYYLHCGYFTDSYRSYLNF